MAEMGKFDHLKERLRAIEGGEDYSFANLEKLLLIPKYGHSQVQGAGLLQVQRDYLLQEPLKDVLSEDGGIRKR